MAIQQNWDNTDLQDYLLYDTWQPSQAMGVLSGNTYANNFFNPQIPYTFDTCPATEALDMEAFRNASMTGGDELIDVSDSLSKLNSNYHRLREIWCSTDLLEEKYPPEFFIDWALSKRFRPDWLDWAIDKGLYTPKELRDLPATIQNTPTAPDYSTSWLKIQQATIAQFFSPRRNPDAKKEEVVDWIKTQALEAGLPDSNNIATTIFTIIKPENHDPKKKRVDPQ